MNTEEIISKLIKGLETAHQKACTCCNSEEEVKEYCSSVLKEAGFEGIKEPIYTPISFECSVCKDTGSISAGYKNDMVKCQNCCYHTLTSDGKWCLTCGKET